MGTQVTHRRERGLETHGMLHVADEERHDGLLGCLRHPCGGVALRPLARRPQSANRLLEEIAVELRVPDLPRLGGGMATDDVPLDCRGKQRSSRPGRQRSGKHRTERIARHEQSGHTIGGAGMAGTDHTLALVTAQTERRPGQGHAGQVVAGRLADGGRGRSIRRGVDLASHGAEAGGERSQATRGPVGGKCSQRWHRSGLTSVVSPIHQRRRIECRAQIVEFLAGDASADGVGQGVAIVCLPPERRPGRAQAA